MMCPKCGYDGGLNDYVDDFLGAYGYHIIAGGRQVGETEMVVQKAVEDARNGSNVLVVEPKHEMVYDVRDRLNDFVGVEEHGGNIEVLSSASVTDLHTEAYDVVLIDNAESIADETLLNAHSMKRSNGMFAILYTPHESSTLLNGFMQYNTEYTSWYIPQSAADHISDETIEKMHSMKSHRAFYRENQARYWDNERDILPDKDYRSS